MKRSFSVLAVILGINMLVTACGPAQTGNSPLNAATIGKIVTFTSAQRYISDQQAEIVPEAEKFCQNNAVSAITTTYQDGDLVKVEETLAKPDESAQCVKFVVTTKDNRDILADAINSELGASRYDHPNIKFRYFDKGYPYAAEIYYWTQTPLPSPKDADAAFAVTESSSENVRIVSGWASYNSVNVDYVKIFDWAFNEQALADTVDKYLANTGNTVVGIEYTYNVGLGNITSVVVLQGSSGDKHLGSYWMPAYTLDPWNPRPIDMATAEQYLATNTLAEYNAASWKQRYDLQAGQQHIQDAFFFWSVETQLK